MLKIKQGIVGYYWRLAAQQQSKTWTSLANPAQTKLFGAALVTNWLALNVR